MSSTTTTHVTGVAVSERDTPVFLRPTTAALSPTDVITTPGVPKTWRECVSKDDKIAWLHSEHGQKILALRPVLLEYYRNGHIFRLIDNRHWKTRLEEWLTLEEEATQVVKSPETAPGKAAVAASATTAATSSPSAGERETAGEREIEKDLKTATKQAAGHAVAAKKGGTVSAAPRVPYGLALPRTEQDKERERDDWLGPRYQNPPLAEHFAESLRRYRDCRLSLEDKLHLLSEGFVVLRGVVPSDLVQRADKAVSEVLRADNEVIHYVGKSHVDREALSEKMKRRRDPHDSLFLSGGTNHIDVLALYYGSPVYNMLEDLLHGSGGAAPHNSERETETKTERPFRAATGGAQIAYRFSQPRPLHVAREKSTAQGDPLLGGLAWHVDGLENGKYGSFSLLVGFALNDQRGDFSGNLCVHPGSHHALLPYLRQYFAASDAVRRGDDAKLYLERHKDTARVPRPDLGEPRQVHVHAGDVVVALHKVAHLGAPNYSRDVRKMLYFRVSHREHAARRSESMRNVWVEFEGMQDLTHMA